MNNNNNKTGQTRFVDSVRSLTSAPLTHRTRLNVRLRFLAVLLVLAPVPNGMAGDPVSGDNSAQPAVTAPTTRPCLTAKQVDAGLAAAMTGDTKMPGLDEVAEDYIQALIREKADVFSGVIAKSQKENSEVRAHIESLYREYRRLAAEEKVTPELRDLYAKEKIGPRLDSIYISEINWQGASPDRSRLAGQVYAYVELVEIERQEREGLKHHADTEKTCLQNWAIRVKHKAISKDKDYHVNTWDEERQTCLAHFKKMFYSSPQYLKAQQFKKIIAEQQVRATIAEQASRDCEGADAAPVALRRRGVNSGADKFQSAIAQAEQEERERPAREARERAAQARVAEEERRASIKAAAEARAYEQELAQKNAQDARDTSAAIGALLGMGQQILQNEANRGQAQQGLDVCVPGYSYDANLCTCQTSPRSAGCSGYVGGGTNNYSGSSSSGARGGGACPGGGNLVNGRCRSGVAQ